MGLLLAVTRHPATLSWMADTSGETADTSGETAASAAEAARQSEAARRATIDMLLVTIAARLAAYAYSSGEHQQVLWADAQRALAELEREVGSATDR